LAVESISGETPQDKIEMLYKMIMGLTISEQRKLLALLMGDEGTSGVREPRRPFRPSSTGAVALEEPEMVDEPLTTDWWRLG